MQKIDNIELKKQYGQHFLQDSVILDKIVHSVQLDGNINVLEIGPGGGALTNEILTFPVARLWAFEIDAEWVQHIQNTITDTRLTVFEQDFLTVDFTLLKPYSPWTILANLPYYLTFPILHLFAQHRELLQEGTIMIQEEVAQKITKKGGRNFGAVSLFYQRFFSWSLLDKVPPESFNPPPKVHSRLLHFVPISKVEPIRDEAKFWLFVKACFAQPRRTLINNLKNSCYAKFVLPDDKSALRAQQLQMNDFIDMWNANL